MGVIGGLPRSLYNHVLHKVLRVYALMINERRKIVKLLLSVSVSLFTSLCLYGLPFLAPCTPCDSSAEASYPTPEGSDNFKQFNCLVGFYNNLASLLHATNDDAIHNIFSTFMPNEFRVVSLAIFFVLYCVLGLINFGIAVLSGLFLLIILMGFAYSRLLALAFKHFVHM